jgi:hypothetical protein
VAYATNGASDFAIIEAKASAGGSVMLPASKPLRSHEVHLQHNACEDANDEEGEHGHAHSGKQPLKARGAEYSDKKLRVRAESDGGEEKRDTELAKSQIRIYGHVPDLPADAPHMAKDQCHKVANKRKPKH